MNQTPDYHLILFVLSSMSTSEYMYAIRELLHFQQVKLSKVACKTDKLRNQLRNLSSLKTDCRGSVIITGATDYLKLPLEGTDFCKTWSVQYSNDCQCVPKNSLIECIPGTNYTELKYQGCATYDVTTSTAHVGVCPFNSLKMYFDRKFVTEVTVENINLTSFMCGGLNRTGLLCSQCQKGMGPALLNYSYPCLECTRYGWVSYFAATLLPATVFLAIVVVFRIDAFSPSLSYYILHCHLLWLLLHRFPNFMHSLSHFFEEIHASPVAQVLLISSGFWSLDFFRVLLPPFCISSEMSILTVLALEYVVALYPLLFTVALYVAIEMHARGCKPLVALWKPFHPIFYRFRKCFNIRGSVITAFSTFICLSYSKILATSFSLTSSTVTYSTAPNSVRNRILFYNASIPVGDTGNIPYYTLAATLTLFCLLPFLTLLLFHTRFCKCLHKFKLLAEVVKSCQRHFKDGSNGSSDFRSFSALPLAMRILTFLILFSTYGHSDVGRFLISFCALLAMSCSYPYRDNKCNYLVIMWYAQLTTAMYSLLYVSSIGHDPLIYAFLVVGIFLPLVHASLLVSFTCVRWLVHTRCVKHCFRSLCPSRCCKRNCGPENEDPLPHRLLDSAEYRPLVPK